MKSLFGIRKPTLRHRKVSCNVTKSQCCCRWRAKPASRKSRSRKRRHGTTATATTTTATTRPKKRIWRSAFRPAWRSIWRTAPRQCRHWASTRRAHGWWPVRSTTTSSSGTFRAWILRCRASALFDPANGDISLSLSSSIRHSSCVADDLCFSITIKISFVREILVAVWSVLLFLQMIVWWCPFSQLEFKIRPYCTEKFLVISLFHHVDSHPIINLQYSITGDQVLVISGNAQVSHLFQKSTEKVLAKFREMSYGARNRNRKWLSMAMCNLTLLQEKNFPFNTTFS